MIIRLIVQNTPKNRTNKNVIDTMNTESESPDVWAEFGAATPPCVSTFDAVDCKYEVWVRAAMRWDRYGSDASNGALLLISVASFTAS